MIFLFLLSFDKKTIDNGISTKGLINHIIIIIISISHLTYALFILRNQAFRVFIIDQIYFIFSRFPHMILSHKESFVIRHQKECRLRHSRAERGCFYICLSRECEPLRSVFITSSIKQKPRTKVHGFRFMRGEIASNQLSISIIYRINVFFLCPKNKVNLKSPDQQ